MLESQKNIFAASTWKIMILSGLSSFFLNSSEIGKTIKPFLFFIYSLIFGLEFPSPYTQEKLIVLNNKLENKKITIEEALNHFTPKYWKINKRKR
jgi:hypothetical protein